MKDIVLSSEYHRRPIRFLELWEYEGWKVKIYGIAQHGERPEPQLVLQAKEITRLYLPQPTVTKARYGVAFVTLHQADLFNQLNIDWWERDNELRHHYFRMNPGDSRFENITASGEGFCVWELQVLAFERQAWMETVLTNTGAPDLTAYLNKRYSAYV